MRALLAEGLPFLQRKRARERGTRMEQLRLLEIEGEVTVRVELDERLRDELTTLMAAAIVAVHQAETEADDE
jgi:hypothetical protein